MADFCRNAKDLIASVHAFAAGSLSQQRVALGANARYFVHLKEGRKHLFGLSKFCAFRGIRLSAYRGERIHDETGGTEARNHLSKLTGEPWVPLRKTSSATQKAFERWFDTLPKNEAFERSRFRLLEISSSHFEGLNQSSSNEPRRKRVITPERLAADLRKQVQVGSVGEKVAMRHEIKRLSALGVYKPRSCVEHVALRNIAEGYDIESVSEKGGVRYIEVKATMGSIENGFFISEGEISELERLGKQAYLYLVELSDLGKGRGAVVAEMSDPVRRLRASGRLHPILYRASLSKRR